MFIYVSHSSVQKAQYPSSVYIRALALASDCNLLGWEKLWLQTSSLFQFHILFSILKLVLICWLKLTSVFVVINNQRMSAKPLVHTLGPVHIWTFSNDQRKVDTMALLTGTRILSLEKIEEEARAEWVYIYINREFTKCGVVFFSLPINIYRAH